MAAAAGGCRDNPQTRTEVVHSRGGSTQSVGVVSGGGTDQQIAIRFPGEGRVTLLGDAAHPMYPSSGHSRRAVPGEALVRTATGGGAQRV
jgi:hypothetical protein